MNCPIQNNNSEILLDYCSRGLSLESTKLIEAHIESCPECKAVTASQKAVWDALDLWEAEPVSADFDRRLYERIERRAGLWARLSGFVSGIHLRPVFTLGAACATVILAMLLSVRSMNFSNQSEPVIRIETSEIEQAERALDDMDMLNKLGVVAMSSDSKQKGKTL